MLVLILFVSSDTRAEFRAGATIVDVTPVQFPVFVNGGMTVGRGPVTGIPLPFVSYGGTFLLMSWVAVAVAARLVGED